MFDNSNRAFTFLRQFVCVLVILYKTAASIFFCVWTTGQSFPLWHWPSLKNLGMPIITRFISITPSSLTTETRCTILFPKRTSPSFFGILSFSRIVSEHWASSFFNFPCLPSLGHVRRNISRFSEHEPVWSPGAAIFALFFSFLSGIRWCYYVFRSLLVIIQHVLLLMFEDVVCHCRHLLVTSWSLFQDSVRLTKR